ncbi:MAG: hypothetical protein AVDCRST_MAG33-2629 [uncultured Thermomicrobiales bacterium]|uniref:Uncharacterized protein n=1 Tax=uncultured Thermomicrobiales bacterium TaxID=1645740 RepID=A0A6J4V9E9_9BACT|nr:MAG: hypothetical protein AVDCRST_MAG33-2629 [uncultured Thermomicrobiales bacterium]
MRPSGSTPSGGIDDDRDRHVRMPVKRWQVGQDAPRAEPDDRDPDRCCGHGDGGLLDGSQRVATGSTCDQNTMTCRRQQRRNVAGSRG